MSLIKLIVLVSDLVKMDIEVNWSYICRRELRVYLFFCFFFLKMCLCVWFSKIVVVNREELKIILWFISIVMLFLCEVVNLKKKL